MRVYSLNNPLFQYLKKTRPQLFAEICTAGTKLDEARILARDSGITILGIDPILATRQKILEYYMAKDANEPNK